MDKQLTEHYLLPLNLCFLVFFGIFVIYELDTWVIQGSYQPTSPFILVICILSSLFLISCLKVRNTYYQAICAILSIVATLAISFPL